MQRRVYMEAEQTDEYPVRYTIPTGMMMLKITKGNFFFTFYIPHMIRVCNVLRRLIEDYFKGFEKLLKIKGFFLQFVFLLLL